MFLTKLKRSLCWPMTILIAGFILTLLLIFAVCLFVTNPFAAYKKSLSAAALKRPDYQRTLTAIEATGPALSVVTFRKLRELALKDRSFDIWVSLSDELSKACAGAVNPVRRIQQVLGLPPVAAKDNVMTVLEVPRDGLIRPCVGKGDIGSARCEFDFPPLPADRTDAAKLKDDYFRLWLVTNQMWTSYRMGFPRDGHGPSDYPYTGFPFTGMGWSYDWSQQSPNHFGVNEFVIKRDAVIKIVSEKTPAEFCQASKPAQ
jgi:hypothetical protein